MLNKTLSLAKEFVSVKSIPENPKELEKVLDIALSHLKNYKIERFESNGSKSALIYNSKKRPKKFKIILNGHLDVIPGKDFQYTPKIKKGKLYGVGSLDMKASVACLIMTFKDVAKMVDYPLALQIVTDEEIGGFNGTKYQISKGVRADFVIAGETTNFNIANKAKGVLWLKISTKGKTAHGAYPWRGKNSIWKMIKFLNLLEKNYPILNIEKWATSVNLAKIETKNTSFNKIPDDCVICLDIRYIPEDKNKIIKNIRKILPKGFKLEIIVNEPSMFVAKNNQYLKKLQKAGEQITNKKVTLYGAHGSSDARHFTKIKCNGVEFGPIGGGIGTDNEWVSVRSLSQYHKILKDFLLSS